MKFGIQAASFYVPQLYLDIKELAIKRDIEPEKLEKGLGLKKMALPDVHEDVATFAAEALLKLVKDYSINPKDIARIYLGTESALDAAKPTAAYVMQMVETDLEASFGTRCFKNCDVVDMTFACVGGVDALHNSLDFVRVNPDKKAIVIASDFAKYELASTGEYTQGAGAVALLISSDPKLLEIENNWGVATESVFDFFKPRRATDKSEWKNANEKTPKVVEIFSDEPVFDGQYSNQCYQDRIREAYFHYKEITQKQKPYENWEFVVFHLPYAFHGKRLFTEIYGIENNLSVETSDDIKAIAKTEGYMDFVKNKVASTQMASSEIGNMYTASIFMALLSAFQVSFSEGKDLSAKEIGFLSYGSGSKSKVFSGKVGSDWKSIVEKWNLFEALNSRKAISFEQYEKLHKKELTESIVQDYKGFGLEKIEKENPVSVGARYYKRK